MTTSDTVSGLAEVEDGDLLQIRDLEDLEAESGVQQPLTFSRSVYHLTPEDKVPVGAESSDA